jgi:branched-chain amino acid transport system ATP-binding protein
VIECDQLTRHFGGLTAVNALSFVAREGAITAVIGPNGAGKTTLFNLVTGFLRPEKGSRVKFFNHDITGAQAHKACRLGIARTFQIPKLFSGLTVLENVVIAALVHTARMDKARDQASEVIHDVGLGPWETSLAEHLPVGHRKLLELARALATRPKFLLLDEIMGGLTPGEVHNTIALLQKLHRGGVSILMIEHVMSAVLTLADHAVVVDYGAKISEGSPRDVVRDPKVIKAYLGGELAEC